MTDEPVTPPPQRPDHRFRPQAHISIGTKLIANAAKPPHLQQTYHQMAHDLKCEVSSMMQVASRLRKRGRLAPNPAYPPKPRRVTPLVPLAQGPAATDLNAPPTPEESLVWLTQEAMTKAANGDFSGINVLTQDERRRGLSYLAQTAPPAVQVQAHKALEEMERAQGTVVGPPPPQSDEELTTRLSALLEAAGPTLSFAAMKVAFPELAK